MNVSQMITFTTNSGARSHLSTSVGFGMVQVILHRSRELLAVPAMPIDVDTLPGWIATTDGGHIPDRVAFSSKTPIVGSRRRMSVPSQSGQGVGSFQQLGR